MSGREWYRTGLARFPDGRDNPHVTGAKVAVVIAVAALGTLFALGSVMAAQFELQGFGDRDGTPSGSYLTLQAAALALSVSVPLLVWRWLLPRSFSWPAAAVAAVVGLAGVAWMLGVGV